jgi:methylated-DNA-protein-cysteine methyltransferase-like protein
LRADGRSAFPPGTPQQAEQLARLRREGVRIDAHGRVRPCRPAKSLDEAIWGR